MTPFPSGGHQGLHSTEDTAHHLCRVVEALGDLAAEHNQGAEAGVSAALDRLIRTAAGWRHERQRREDRAS